jgi:hypothetical protein
MISTEVYMDIIALNRVFAGQSLTACCTIAGLATSRATVTGFRVIPLPNNSPRKEMILRFQLPRIEKSSPRDWYTFQFPQLGYFYIPIDRGLKP